MAGGGRLHHQSPAGKKGGPGEAEATGANPTDRGKCGSKRHLLTEGGGIPLATVVTGAQRQESTQLATTLDAGVLMPPVRQEGEMRHLCMDRGYDAAACRETAVAQGYVPHIPPKASAATPLPPPGDPARHPPRRWVVEVSHSWFNRFRRLLVRWEKKAANYRGMVQLAACLIVYRKLRHARSLSG